MFVFYNDLSTQKTLFCEGVPVFRHLLMKRFNSAKIFPHLGERGKDFIKRIQGVYLGKAGIRALKRE
jgi:hypothetical protein